jgi:hypothetical protein
MAKKAKKSKPKPHKVHKAARAVHKAKAVHHTAHAKPVRHLKPAAVHRPVHVEHHVPAPMPTALAPSAPVMVVPQGAPMPAAQVDRVHLQNISFEMASMKRTLERMLHQLEKLEESVAERRGESE